MIVDLIAVLFMLLWLAVGAVARPQRAQCARGDYVEGVRPNGFTRCIQRSTEPEIDCSGTKPCLDTSETRYTTPLKIYCTNGQIPIVVDERTIGCQARH